MKRVHGFVEDERPVKIQRTRQEFNQQPAVPVPESNQQPAVPVPESKTEYITRQEVYHQSAQYQEIFISLHTRIVALEQERRRIQMHCGMEYQN